MIIKRSGIKVAGIAKCGAKYKMPMGDDFKGEIIAGTNEPLHTWEVFYWTRR